MLLYYCVDILSSNEMKWLLANESSNDWNDCEKWQYDMCVSVNVTKWETIINEEMKIWRR